MYSLQAKAVINLPFGRFMGELWGLGNVGDLFDPRTLFSCIVLWMAERGLKQSKAARGADWRKRSWGNGWRGENVVDLGMALIKKMRGHPSPHGMMGGREEAVLGQWLTSLTTHLHLIYCLSCQPGLFLPESMLCCWLGTTLWTLTRLWCKTLFTPSLSERMEAMRL